MGHITEQDISIYEAYKQFEREVPYSFILLRELHASENDHTRILISLLKYPGKDKDNTFPLLRSFLREIVFKNWENDENGNNNDRDAFIDKLCKGLKDIPFNQNLIDAQIGTNDACIIIENKVCNAEDRDTQLERYADIVKQKGVEKENIWVMYLTGDGKKTPSPSSLTEDLMKELNIKPAHGEEGRKEQIERHSYFPIISDKPIRFVEANYAHDILDWLEKAKKQVSSKEKQYLIPGIEQYIAFLQNLYFVLPEEKQMTENLIKRILEITANNGAKQLSGKSKAIFEYNEHLGKLKSLVEKEQENIKNKIVERLRADTSSYLAKKAGCDTSNIITAGGNGNWMWFQIGKENTNIHFEWGSLEDDLLKSAEVNFLFHIERGKEINQKIKKGIKKDLGEHLPQGFDESDKKKYTFVVCAVPINLTQYINAIDNPEQAYEILSNKLDVHEVCIKNLIKYTDAKKIEEYLARK